MTEEQIQEIREKHPLPLDEICLHSSFTQVLGNKPEDYTEEERKTRWQKIMSFDKKMEKYWSDISECIGCIHLKDAWCDLQGLPCTYNPILTPSTGMIGVACYGVGKVEREPKLFDI